MCARERREREEREREREDEREEEDERRGVQNINIYVEKTISYIYIGQTCNIYIYLNDKAKRIL